MLAGKRALVTGGGSGIGAGIARRLLEAGAVVTIAGRTLEKLEDTAARLRGQIRGAEVRISRCDITRFAEIEATADQAAEGGGLDIAVANAGGLGSQAGPFLFLGEQAWRDACEINIVGSANTIRAAALRMRERGGSIVAVSTAVSRAPQVANAHYVASKAALNMIIVGAAWELGHFNIRVNGLLPGFTLSEMTSEIPPDIVTQHIARSALKRASTPEEQGDLVVFLATEQARFITGQLIAVDGGLSIQPQSDASSATRAMFGDSIHDEAFGPLAQPID